MSAASLIPFAAHAQAESDQLDEIVITAERRAGSVQKTPLSVGVIDAVKLERQGFAHLTEIDKSVAGVTFFRGAGNQQSSIIIRGIGTTNQGYTQAVGVYVDDVPLIRSVAAGQWDLPDIERIEVLRGPQGTLYGQNATAGAVKIVSRDPGQVREGWISAGLGNYGAFETRAYLSGPLIENLLSASFAVTKRERGGLGKNPATGEKIHTTDVLQARGKLRFTPGNGYDAVLAVDGLIDESDNGTNGTPLNLPGIKPRDKYFREDLTSSRLVRGGASLRVTKDFSDSLSLRSITAYRAYEHDPDPMDLGGLPVIGNEWRQAIRQHTFSQEVQLLGQTERFDYTLGALFIHENWFNDNSSIRNLVATSTILRQQALTEYDVDDIGIYAQIDWRLSQRLSLSVGGRYYKTEQTYDASAWNLNADFQRTSEIFSVAGLETRSDGFTPRLSLNFAVTPDVFAYVSYTEGAKFGGFNRSATTVETASIPADPETVSSYETGLKTRAWGGRLQVNATAFYNEYEDYLAVIANPVINGVTVAGSVLANAAKASSYGAEFEVRARPTSALTLDLSLAYLHTEFDSFLNPSGAASGDFTGNRLPFAPELTAALNAAYAIPVGNNGEVTLSGSYTYTSDQYIDHTENPLTLVPERHLVDAAVEYRQVDGPWRFSLRVRNLFDKDYEVLKTSIPAFGVYSAAYNEPRVFLASFRYDF